MTSLTSALKASFDHLLRDPELLLLQSACHHLSFPFNRNCTSISVWQEWKWAEEMGNDTLSTHRSYHLKDVDESFKTSLSRISLSILILHCAQCQTLFQIHEETESTRSPPNYDDRNHPFECSTGHQLLPLAWILAKLNYCSHQNTPTFPTFPWAKKIDAFLTFTFQRSRGTDDGLASHLEFLKNTSKMQCMSCRPNKSEFKLKGHPKVPKDLCLPRSFIIFQGSTSFHTKLRYPHLCGLVWESLVQATKTVEDSLKIPLFNMGLRPS